MDEQKIWFHFERDWEIYVLKVKVWVFVALVPQFTLYLISGAVLYSPLPAFTCPAVPFSAIRREGERTISPKSKIQSANSKRHWNESPTKLKRNTKLDRNCLRELGVVPPVKNAHIPYWDTDIFHLGDTCSNHLNLCSYDKLIWSMYN